LSLSIYKSLLHFFVLRIHSLIRSGIIFLIFWPSSVLSSYNWDNAEQIRLSSIAFYSSSDNYFSASFSTIACLIGLEESEPESF
jgi:hypothetical protein